MTPKNLVAVFVAAFVLLTGALIIAPFAHAGDLPVVSSSPVAGITFDDKPLSLPVQRNFQMAMLTTSSELGRTCGRIESYGWRLTQAEQGRVNQIFNSMVDHLRAQAYTVETKTPSSVARDVTVFTADRPGKNLIFMWSAGEIGLVMVLCDSTAPLTGRVNSVIEAASSPSVQVFPEPKEMGSRRPTITAAAAERHFDKFSPVGDWVGSYSCAQGATGATLRITSAKNGRFDGTFRFYPTPSNPYVPTGSYEVYGDYEPDTGRILINPGKWLQRPKDYYNTILIGSFDPGQQTFSGYFQGITGCTSLEAKYSRNSNAIVKRTGKKHGTTHGRRSTAKLPKNSVTNKMIGVLGTIKEPGKAAPATGDAAPQISAPVANAPAAATVPSAPVAPAAPAQPEAPPVPTAMDAVMSPAAPAMMPTPAAPAQPVQP